MNKWCKSAVCLALCTGLFLSLSACTSFMELYERLLIHGIGIDCGKNGYVVTVRSSTSSEEEGEEFFKSEGETVLEAEYEELYAISDGRLFVRRGGAQGVMDVSGNWIYQLDTASE